MKIAVLGATGAVGRTMLRVLEERAFPCEELVLLAAGATRSKQWAPIAAQAGAVVIDNSSGWRMHPDVPLIVPEVNGRRVLSTPLGIIANPNCATIQLVVALEA